MTAKDFLGITVLTPHIQNEGVANTLDKVVGIGATAVAINTSVVAPSAEGEGSFQPPDDAGSSPRLLERKLWGKEALWLRSGPGHEVNRDFFADSPYKPREPNDLTLSDGPIIEEFIGEAKARGLKVYIQTSATAPPGLKGDDTPHLPDGRIPPNRMAATGCLASPAIRAYNRAWTQDIFAQYPQLDGIRPDWPEYPCYKLDEAFQGFGPHVEHWATRRDFDFERIKRDVLAFYQYLHGHLTDADLMPFSTPERSQFAILDLYNQYPGVVEWFRLKAALSSDLLRDWRDAITTFGGAEKELSANAFISPFSYVTGLSPALAAKSCSSISVKLYAMHWSLMVEFWAEALLEANPNLSENVVVRALVNLFDLANSGEEGSSIADYGYPEPDEPHPISSKVQLRKVEQAVFAMRGQAKVNALVHGYGPLDDFKQRFEVALKSSVNGIWINRYGYLGDDKLEAIGDLWAGH